MNVRGRLALAALTATLACTGSDDDDGKTDVRDAGTVDTGTTPDGGVRDAGIHDGGSPDTGIADAGFHDAGTQTPGLRIPGLTAPVTVNVDEHGIVNVRCSSDDDCFAAQGYFHAANRFQQMDIRRRAGTGRLSEVFGPFLLDTDRAIRRFVATSTGASIADRLWANANPQTKRMAEAYTVGVNAWLEDLKAGTNGAQLPPSYLPYRRTLSNWEPKDTVACILPLIEDLTNQSAQEISLGERYARLSPAQAVDLLGLEPASKSSVLSPLDATERSLDLGRRLFAAESIRGRLDHARDVLASASANTIPDTLTELDGFGSNNWALGGGRTASGNAILAVDPHLGLSQPAVWFLVNIDSKSNGGSVHAAGASFAGLPGIIFGQNEDIAWGSTTTFFDMADVYIETLDATGDAVMFNGQAVPFLEVDHRINVLGASPETETVRYVPHHGPVVAYDETMGMAVTIRWTGASATTDANFIWEMMTATSVSSARTALENVTTVGQNWLVVDRAGEVGWFPYNQVPNRPWASDLLPPWLPLPGDGTAEWQGFVPYAQLPQAVNPPQGFIATANNDMTGSLADGDPTNDGQVALQHFVAPGFRHERIVDRLAAGTAHTVEDMQTLQADVYSLIGAQTSARLIAAARDGSAMLSPAGASAVDKLAAWDFTCPTGLQGHTPDALPATDPSVRDAAVGCSVFHLVWWRIFRQAFGDELGAAGVSPIADDSAGYRLLLEPSRLIGGASYWDDINTLEVETSTSVIVTAFNGASSWLEGNVALNPDEWFWGRIHTMTLTPDLLGQLTSRYDHGPFSSDGGLYTVDVANPGGRYRNEYDHLSGPSMRLVCEADPAAMRCTVELPGGQSDLPSSPNFDDLLLLHLDDIPTPLPFTPTEVDDAAVQTIMIPAAE